MSRLQDNYISILAGLKERIRTSRTRAALAINKELLFLYWELGNTILSMQRMEGWGAKVIERISADLKSDFPDFRGLSPRNLKYMVAFAKAYPQFVQIGVQQVEDPRLEPMTIVQGALAQLSWYHIITLLDKVKDNNERDFYILQSVQSGWSRDVMVHQIESNLHLRVGSLPNNFVQTLPAAESDLVKQIFKDPYKLDFIAAGDIAKERDLEDVITKHVTKFLLELGQHFAFMGRQYKMVLGDKEYFYDLLFYHTRLKRYIIIELKIDEFKPEYKGKMEFYLTLADDLLKQEGDGRSIGLILCKTKDGLVAEYALRDSTAPIGIAEYTLGKILPDNIEGELPTIEELEAQIEKEIEELKKPSEKKYERLKEMLKDFNQPELKERKSVESNVKVYTDVVIPIREKINQALAELGQQFAGVNVRTFALGSSLGNDEANIAYLKQDPGGDAHSVHYRLAGFRKAGAKAFDIDSHLTFRLHEYKYSIMLTQHHPVNPLIEKLYHELPSEAEMDAVIDKMVEVMIDDITFQVERIKEEMK
jgi:predicted nuclease of restriction endonuclease-like (RecB) superfamily